MTIKPNPTYIVAVETGGSHCRAILFDNVNHQILKSVTLDKPGHIANDRHAALQSVTEILEDFSSLVSADMESFKKNTQLTLCLAGTENETSLNWLKDQLAWTGPYHAVSDVMAGFMAAFEDMRESEGILIGGTGNVAVGYSKGGFLLVKGTGADTELCCGYSIGQRALLSEDLQHNEQFQAACSRVAAKNGVASIDPHTTSKFIISQLAPCVFELAEKEHMAAACDIIDASVQDGFAAIKELAEQGITRFGVVGGVAQRLLPQIEEQISLAGLNAGLFPVRPETIGSLGALNVANYIDKHPDGPQVLKAMQDLYKPKSVAAVAKQAPRSRKKAGPAL